MSSKKSYSNIIMSDVGESNFFSVKKDPEYQEKLELSYRKCLSELCNYEEIEDELKRIKFTVDPNTGKRIRTHIFPLNGEDDIKINSSKHSYVFKRSKFYSSFDKPKSFLKRDLISYWNKKNYFVKVVKISDNKWGLQLSW